MNKEEINKLLKNNPIKIIKFDDIEVPVEWLKQSTVNINGNDYIKLQQENKKLKKQLEEERNKVREYSYKLSNFRCEETYENQQKEFISYLENEKDRIAKECSQIYEDSLGKTKLVNEDIFNEVDKILSKYKEIIGVENEK